MSPSNVKLILLREIRDQLRDRRTLFVVLVLPILLYPLLGMSYLQIQQFLQKKPSEVLVIGAKNLPEEPPLIDNNRRFVAELFASPEEARLLQLDFASDEPADGELPATPRERARWRVCDTHEYDAALVVGNDFGEQIDAFRAALGRREQPVFPANVPAPEPVYTSGRQKSAVAGNRLETVLARWKEAVVRRNLEAADLPTAAVEPFEIKSIDLAEEAGRQGAAIWSKILPFLLVVWALTGAFYPAVDLCAGEKERGTLETLLSSPARRTEIVLGKLLCVMLFSIVTAVLNLVSTGITGWAVSPYMPGLGPPPVSSAIWLGAALVPISALFGALSLAMAALARSTKEGQYYLMPLLMVVLPLTMLPMSPAVELNVGNSLVPVTGVVLLLRSLLEGEFASSLRYAPIVLGVTLVACYLAIRWAVGQFNSESVLFRQGERFGLRLWLLHLRRERGATPTVGAAITCAVLILVVKFAVSIVAPGPQRFESFAVMHVIAQVGLFVVPAVLMAWFFTRDVGRTLLVRWPTRWTAIPAAVVLALALRPVMEALRQGVTRIYPVDQGQMRSLAEMFEGAEAWQLFLLLALVPAICEELAFRGFILSGLRRLGSKWRAICYSAVFFGLVHMILQQQLIAVLMGMVIGFIAVQSGSIFVCMLLHLLNNALALSHAFMPEAVGRWPWLEWFVTSSNGKDYTYQWHVVLLGGFITLWILFWFSRLPYAKSPEEELQEAIDRTAREEDDRLLGVQDSNAAP